MAWKSSFSCSTLNSTTSSNSEILHFCLNSQFFHLNKGNVAEGDGGGSEAGGVCGKTGKFGNSKAIQCGVP